jgi:hypothetical protein
LFCRVCLGDMEYEEQGVHAKKFLEQPTDVVHLALSFLQKWKLLMQPVERSKVESLILMVQTFAREFKP